MSAQIESIVYKPTDAPKKPSDHFSRVALSRAMLIENYGIEGDSKGGHPRRQLNLMCAETLDQLAADGFKASPGWMGEQLIIRGLPVNINDLKEGTTLSLGVDAIIEVTGARSGCERFESIQSKSRDLAAGRMGIMARVITGGAIAVGDPVVITKEPESSPVSQSMCD